MNLKPEQKEFIEQKVKELGSLEAVKQFYCKKKPLRNVDKYAMKIAKQLYKEAK